MDEFSDFQMAVQMPTPNVVSMGIPPPLFNTNHVGSPSHGNKKSLSSSGVRFSSDSSPVHSIASHTSKSDLVHSQLSSSHSVTSCSPATNKFGASVGSRLANYDLGLSGPQTQATNGFQNSLDLSLTPSSLSSCPKIINNVSNHHKQQPSLQFPRSNQDLLIGEEDKYSALRMLIETDFNSSSSSVFEQPTPTVDEAAKQNHMNTEPIKSRPVEQNSISNGFVPNVNSSTTALFNVNASNSVNSNSSTVVNSNSLMGALKFPIMGNNPTADTLSPSKEASAPAGDFSDFGDFQSFTGFGSASTTTPATPPNSNHSVFLVTSNSTVDNFLPQPQSLPATVPLNSHVTNSQPTLDFLLPTTSEPIQNGTCESDDGDTEFGDFVSVEPVVPEVSKIKLPPAPAPAPLPTVSPWNKHFDLSPLTLINQTPPPLPPTLQEDKENIEDIMDIGGYFSNYTSPLENDLSHPLPKPEQEQQPPTSVQETSDAEDEFDTFSGFTSNGITDCSGDTSTSNSNREKIVECSAPKSNQVSFSSSSVSASTFIRTSLIRNDKVTDIDPTKWNHGMSVEESNNECTVLDYSSCDKKDFSLSGGGKSKFLDISPETRSIASLDLGNYVTADYTETSSINNNTHHNNNNNNNLYNPVASQQNLMQSNGLKSGSSLIPATVPFNKRAIPAEEQTIYDDYDKYQCFRQECENEKERYHSEWKRCLLACKEMISKAFAVFNGVSTSEVLREVVADEKGYSYVMNVLEIYRISQRIQKSATRLGVHSKLESISIEITNLWETLSAFLLGTCVSTEMNQENLDSVDCCTDNPSASPEDSLPSCGVCLCSVNTSKSSQVLDYGGKIYHCKCANFWVNEVDAILPSLSYVSNVVASSNNTSTTTTSSFHGSNSNRSKFDKTNSLVSYN